MSYASVEDPEVLADLKLRSATERDPSRAREMPTYATPKVVDKVPCRARCGNVCDWTEEAVQAFETCNRILAARDEAPLDQTKIAFCAACRARGATLAADNSRQHVERLGALIRELKASSDPGSERDLIKQLGKLGHPDVEGLTGALRDARAKQPSGRRVKASDVLR